MSFLTAIQAVKKVVLEDKDLRKVLKETLTRIGTAKLLDLRHCDDPNDISVTLIPTSEDENNDTLSFDENGHASIQVNYVMIARFRFEKAIIDINNKPIDRIEDSNNGPGLLSLVRMVKSAMGADYTEDLGDKIGRGINLKYLGTKYKLENPMVQADITIQISEVVEIGYRKAIS
jgi:hypothetical protein